MDFADVVKSRRSVRSYDSSREITDAQLKELFELVKFTPSPYNLQPWEFVVVRSEKGKRILQEIIGQEHVGKCSAVVIALGASHFKNAEEVVRDRMKKGTMDEAKRKVFYERMKRISADKGLTKELSDCSCFLAIMTLILAAKDRNLDTCLVGLFEDERVKRIKDSFRIPEDYDAVILITVGYASGKQPERPMRFGFEDIVYFEEFGKK